MNSQWIPMHLALYGSPIFSAPAHDQADMALRCQQLADRIPVVIGIGKIEHHIDLAETQRFQLRCQRVAMVDHMLRAHRAAPVDGLGARGGGDHGEAGASRQLDRDRSNPTASARSGDRGAWPARRASTSWNCALLPGRVTSPA